MIYQGPLWLPWILLVPSDAGLWPLTYSYILQKWHLSYLPLTSPPSFALRPGHWSLLGKIGEKVRNIADGRLHGSKRYWRAYESRRFYPQLLLWSIHTLVGVESLPVQNLGGLESLIQVS